MMHVVLRRDVGEEPDLPGVDAERADVFAMRGEPAFDPHTRRQPAASPSYRRDTSSLVAVPSMISSMSAEVTVTSGTGSVTQRSAIRGHVLDREGQRVAPRCCLNEPVINTSWRCWS